MQVQTSRQRTSPKDLHLTAPCRSAGKGLPLDAVKLLVKAGAGVCVADDLQHFSRRHMSYVRSVLRGHTETVRSSSVHA